MSRLSTCQAVGRRGEIGEVVSDIIEDSGLIPRRPLPRILADVAVLILEYRCRWATMLRQMLEPSGAAIVTAKSSEEAKLVLQAFRPEVIFCDLIGSGRDASAFVAWLRRRPERRLRDIPTVGLTTSHDVTPQGAALDNGFDLVMQKDVDCDQIPSLVASLAARSHRREKS